MKKSYKNVLISFLAICLGFNLFAQKKVEQSFKNSISKQGFIENKGQIIDQNNHLNLDVKFLLNQPGLNIQLKKNSFSYDAYKVDIKYKTDVKDQSYKNISPSHINYNYHRIDVEFIGANSNPVLIAEQLGDDYLNYYTTGTPEIGITYVKHFGKITYKNLYDGIDLEFLSRPETDKPVEYNFIIHPGADISQIKWIYKGSNEAYINNRMLKINTIHGTISEKIPYSYEKETNKKVIINYKALPDNSFGFEGNINIEKTLIIDPLPILNWSTYYGGAVLDDASGISIDPSGNIVVTGETTSTTNIATTGAYQTTMAGGTIQYLWGGDAYLAKFSSSGNRIWATYYGGTGEDCGWNVKTDKKGDIFVSGDTKSTTGIATTGAFQTTVNTSYHDPYLAKFSSSGTRLWGTYFGGSGNDRTSRNAMVVDTSGNVYLAGTNNTANDNWITTVGAYQRTNGSTSAYDCPFVAKFSPTGARIWGTYYGGPLHDQCYSIALDASNNVYLTGGCTSTTLMATTGAYQTALAGGTDAFICKLNSTGTAVLWATYYGGTGTDIGNTIAVDPNGDVIVSGYTTSTSGIASSGAYKTSYMGGAYDGFLLKFSPSGSRIWGTYTGGSVDDIPRTMLVNSTGEIITVMQTSSTSGLTTSDGLVTSYIGGTYDACLQKYSSAGTLKLGTYLGGNLEDIPWNMDMDNKSNIYLAGRTTSTLYISTTGAHQTTFGGGTYDGVITKFQDLVADLSIENASLSPSPVCSNHEADITVKVKNNGPIDATQMILAVDLKGQNRITKPIILNNLKVGKDTVFTVPKLFNTNISGKNMNLNIIHILSDLNPVNDTFKATITVNPSPSGASLIKGSLFNTTQFFTAGSLTNPDIVAENDTLTYEITPPNGFSNNNYGTAWVINNITLRTKGGRTLPSKYYLLSGASVLGNANVKFLPDQPLTDTAIVLIVSLLNLSGSGCDSLLSRNIFVAPRVMSNFSFNQPVCDGENVVFSNSSTISSGNFTSRWDFGTGNPSDTSSNIDVAFKFPSYGTYYVTLYNKSFPYGYITSKTIAVTVSEIPKINFKVINACYGDSLSFINTTSISAGKVDYLWNFGNGVYNTKLSPKYKYAQAGGYKVTLTATSNGCSQTLTKNAQQFARPVAKYNAPSVLCDKTEIRFTNGSTISIGNMGYLWNFGDGTISGETNPFHSFSTAGNKTIKIKVISEFGCADSITKTITLAEAPSANFTTGLVCNLSPAAFSFTGTKPAGFLTNFNWQFDNEGTTSVENPTKLFSTVGKKTITLTITSNNGCADVISKEIDVKLQSKADFEVTDVCDGDEAVFTNKSTVSSGNLLYNWKFGDGTNTAVQSPRHIYPSGSSTYNVTLLAIVPGGCSDSMIKPISINAMPISNFTYSTSGHLVYFTPTQTGNTIYHWDFGDGGTSETSNSQYHYLNDFGYGKYTACLTTVNAAGCLSQTCKTIVITGGVDKLTKLSGVKVYPNPNKGTFTVTVEDPKSDIAIGVYNLLGEVVKTIETSSLKSTYSVDLNVANGVYLVKVTNGGLTSTQKVTINK